MYDNYDTAEMVRTLLDEVQRGQNNDDAPDTVQVLRRANEQHTTSETITASGPTTPARDWSGQWGYDTW